MSILRERYVDPQYVYRFTQGPDVVRSQEDAIRDGINCVSLAHLALRDLFQHELAPDLFCYELYSDDEQFESVGGVEEMIEGDLVWLGVARSGVSVADFVPEYSDGQLVNWSQCPINHVAIAIGETDDRDEPLLLHASPSDGTNAVWPLSKFGQYSRYRKIHAITRLKAQDKR